MALDDTTTPTVSGAVAQTKPPSVIEQLGSGLQRGAEDSTRAVQGGLSRFGLAPAPQNPSAAPAPPPSVADTIGENVGGLAPYALAEGARYVGKGLQLIPNSTARGFGKALEVAGTLATPAIVTAQTVGDIQQRRDQEAAARGEAPTKPSVADDVKDLATGLGSAALFHYLPGAVGSRVAGALPAATSTVGRIAARAAEHGAGLGVTSAANTELERAAAGQDLTSPEAMHEVGQSAVGGALLGAPFGVAHGALERPQPAIAEPAGPITAALRGLRNPAQAMQEGTAAGHQSPFEQPQPEQGEQSQEPPGAAEPITDRTGQVRSYKGGDEEIDAFKNLSPQERQVEQRAADQVLQDPQEAVQAYRNLPGTDGGRIISTDEAREVFPDYNYGPEGRSANALAVHEPSSYVAKKVWQEELDRPPLPGKEPVVMFMAGGTGSGKTTAVSRIPDIQQIKDKADIVYDGNLQSFKSANEKISEALDTGRKVNITYINRDPIDAFTNGALPRAARDDYGRTVPVDAHVNTHIGAAKTVAQLADYYKGDPRVDIRIINNATGKEPTEGGVSDVASTANLDHNTLRNSLLDNLAKEREAGRVPDRVWNYYGKDLETQARPGNGGENPPASGELRPQELGRSGNEGNDRQPQQGTVGAEPAFSRPTDDAQPASNAAEVAEPQTVKTTVGDRKVSRAYDVPLLGSSGKDGTIYIDKSWNPIVQKGPLKGLDRTPMLAEHEAVEADAEKNGSNYSKAHYDHAEPAEHKVLLDTLGLKPDTPEASKAIEDYEKSYHGELARDGKETANVPPDLIDKPYDHPHSVEQRRQQAAVEAREPGHGHTVESLAHELAGSSLGRALGKLERAGKLDLVHDAKSEPWAGKWENGKATLNAAWIEKNGGVGLVLHELGVHGARLGDILSPAGLERVNRLMDRMTGADADLVKQAEARIPGDTSKGQKAEERVAYFVELAAQQAKMSNPVRATFALVSAKLKAALLDTVFGKQLERFGYKLSADDMVALAKAAVQKTGDRTGVSWSKPGGTKTFFSAINKSIDEAKGAPKKGGEALKQWLDGAQRRGEFKGSERQWLGVDQWLDSHPGATRQELADFVRANKVEVKPVKLEDKPRTHMDELSDGRTLAHNQNETKFGQYVLPGGSDYREHLLTLPATKVSPEERELSNLNRVAEEGLGMSDRERERRKQLIDTGVRSVPFDDANAIPQTYRSGHYDEPNILAHVRMNDRTTADGKSALHIEEIQSDLHQAGRKRGYRGDESAEVRAAQKSFDESASRGENAAYWRDANPEFVRVLSDFHQNSRSDAVPNFPLKNTDEWAMLGFKHALREAVETGKDKVTWTTGEQQAERYDLSKQVDKIVSTPTGEKTRSVRIAMKNDQQHELHVNKDGIVDGDAGELGAKGKPLSDVIGKELADKVMSSERATLSGNDLRIGGEGMRGFYDKILPKAVERYVKQWGGKVGESKIDTGTPKAEGWDHIDTVTQPRNGVVKVHSVDITPAMRESVERGQPLFSKPDTRESKPEIAYGGDNLKQKDAIANRIFDKPYRELSAEDKERVNEVHQTTALDQNGAMFSKPDEALSRPNIKAILAARANAKKIEAIKDSEKELFRNTTRAAWAHMQRAIGEADGAVDKTRDYFDTLIRKAGGDFRKVYQSFVEYQQGGIGAVKDGEAKAFMGVMEKMFSRQAQEIRRYGEDKLGLLDNYVPQIWKDQGQAPPNPNAQPAPGGGKRPLGGKTGFRKERVFGDYKEGFDAGREPEFANPIDAVMSRWQAGEKYLSALAIREGLERMGMLKEVGAQDRVPEGYARVNDSTFAGHVVPERVARDLNGYLSPGLTQFKAWRGFRWLQNALLSARLGFSAFHAGFTTVDSAITHLDLAMRSALLHGDIASAVKHLVQVPLTPIKGLGLLGRGIAATALDAAGVKHNLESKLLRQFAGKEVMDANTAALMHALTEGGARARMDATDMNNDFTKVLRSWRQEGIPGLAKSPMKLFGAVLEGTMRPIAHYLVPAQKMVARMELMKYELDTRAKALGQQKGDYAGLVKAIGPDALRQISHDIIKRVDDRLGQMAYDNLFWNRTVKDIAQASIQSVGWNTGTWNVVFGGLKDIGKIFNPEKLLAPLDAKGDITDAQMSRITGRLSYLVALNAGIATLGAVTQYLLTGKGPDAVFDENGFHGENIRDYFFPKTGQKNVDGTDARLSFPSYVKDEFGFVKHPLDTITHKLHPSLSMIAELIQNKDFYGNEVYNPHDQWTKVAEQIGGYIAGGFRPYAVQNRQQIERQGGGLVAQALPFIGITPAPGDITHSAFQNFVHENRHRGDGKTPEEQAQSQKWFDVVNAIKRGEQPDMSQLSPKERTSALKYAKSDPIVKQFTGLSFDNKLEAYNRASDAERQQYHLKAAILKAAPRELRNVHDEDERKYIIQKVKEVRAQ